MKILHTNFLHGWGGQSNRILNACRGLAQRGHEVLIAAPEDSELVRRARAAGLEADGSMRFARGFRPLSVLRDVARMRRLIAARRFDVLHTHGSQDSWIVALADWPKRVPIVRTKHNLFPVRDHPLNRRLYGRVFDRIVCISTAIVEQCAAKPYIARERLVRIHSAVDVERYARCDPAAVAVLRAQWAGRHPVIILVGRLRPEKGHRYLFDALARLRGDFPRILAVLAGEGSQRDELQERVAALGVGEHVRFLGQRNDVPELLHAVDIFVMPSVSEGLGSAAIEASVAALPIVAARGGTEDVVLDGRTGLIVEPRDVDGLTRAIATLASDRALARRLGEAARQHAVENFTIDNLVARNEALYVELLTAWGRLPTAEF